MKQFENVFPYESEFPHEMLFPFLLGDDLQDSMTEAAKCLYAHYAAMAFGEYLKRGPGFLIGPFVTGADGLLLEADQLRAVLSADKPVAFRVYYTDKDELASEAEIIDTATRQRIAPALDKYNPEDEVPILLLRDNKPCRFLPKVGCEGATPRELYGALQEGLACERQRKPN